MLSKSKTLFNTKVTNDNIQPSSVSSGGKDVRIKKEADKREVISNRDAENKNLQPTELKNSNIPPRLSETKEESKERAENRSNEETMEGPDGTLFKKISPEESAQRTVAKKEEENQQKFEELIDQSNKVLFELKAVFPFDFFPNKIIIDLNRVNIIIKEFFFSERRHSIDFKDIGDVLVETSPFFATLKIVDEGFPEGEIKISYLKKNEAIRARQIIQGLVTCKKEEIDVTKLEDTYLLEKIEELGRIKAHSNV